MFGICKRKQNDAFTLIELTIAIAVIATLSLITIISFNKIQSNARDSQRSVKISLISESLEKYYDNNGDYPSCSVMSQTPSVVISTLKDLTPDTLAAPTAPADTNSIVACEGEPTTDVYHYIGGGSEYTLKYKEEVSGTVVSVKSRHSIPAPIPDVPTFPITVNPPVASVVVINPPTKVHCNAGDPEYHFRYRIDDSSEWITPGAWETDQASVAYNLTTKQGKKYGLQMQARCNQLGSTGSTLDSPEATVIPQIITIPTAPVVAVNTVADTSSWSWSDLAGACTEETTVSYRYKYTISPSGYDSNWTDYENLSVSFTTNVTGQTYKVEVQARCDTPFAAGPWSVSGSADYVNAAEVVSDNYVKISAGSSHNCAIASDNRAYCWGFNATGQAGDDTSGNNHLTPIATTTTGALSGLTIKSITTGGYHTCAIASDNKAYCWGSNTKGQIGDGTSGGSRDVPTAVITTGALAGLTIKSIAAGGEHTCAIASDDRVYCWGSNFSGQIGNGIIEIDHPIPTAVITTGALAGLTIKSIAAGGTRNCVIASDNNVYCWGNNSSGQIGDGTSGTNRLVPTAVIATGVLAGLTIKSMAVGNNSTCVIASDDNVYCWGYNGSGQIGDGTSGTNRLVPTAVITTGALAGLTIKSIAAGGAHICAVASDNNAYCWGYNDFGQIGDGTSGTNRLVPTAVITTGALAGLTIKSIATGEKHTCAIVSDNNAYCWGYNLSGQIGDDTSGTNRLTPTSIGLSITTSTVVDTSTWTWQPAVCFATGLSTYQYRYTISPSGYDSGWVGNGSNLSVAFTTSTFGQTYKVEAQSKCPGSINWSSTASVGLMYTTVTGNIASLVPTGYITSTGNAPTTSTYSNINKKVANYDSTYFVAATNSISTAFYDITDMPSNFREINFLMYFIRYQITPLVNDTETLSVRIYKADRMTPLTNEMLVKSTTIAVAETTIQDVVFTGIDTTATKADWDGAVLAIATTHSASGGRDNSIWSINEVEIKGSYDQLVYLKQ